MFFVLPLVRKIKSDVHIATLLLFPANFTECYISSKYKKCCYADIYFIKLLVLNSYFLASKILLNQLKTIHLPQLLSWIGNTANMPFRDQIN